MKLSEEQCFTINIYSSNSLSAISIAYNKKDLVLNPSLWKFLLLFNTQRNFKTILLLWYYIKYIVITHTLHVIKFIGFVSAVKKSFSNAYTKQEDLKFCFNTMKHRNLRKWDPWSRKSCKISSRNIYSPSFLRLPEDQPWKNDCFYLRGITGPIVFFI